MHPAAALQKCCCAAARLQQLLRLAPVASAAPAPSRRTHSHSTAAACLSSNSYEPLAYVSQPVQTAGEVPVPLCKRPGQHVEQLSALMEWRQSVLQQIANIKDSFQDADGGPSAAELQAWRELDEQQWQPCTNWQQMDMELAAAGRRSKPTEAWQVLLTAPVQHLHQLWQLRLQDRVPFQYLIATAHWRDLVLSVGPGILVPRPETEAMIDLAAAALAANPSLAALPWADLGTGSGALAIGTAKLLLLQQQQRHHQQQEQQQPQQPEQEQPVLGDEQHPVGRVYAVDLSHTAVAYATANAAAHGVQGAVQAVQGSWFSPLQHLQGRLGGVLSNPPYIPRVQIEAGLQAEVVQHEPLSALDGGLGEGMDSLQVICEQAVTMLAPGGYLVLETAGADQAPLVKQLLQQLQAPAAGGGPHAPQAAFVDVAVHEDCYGVPRFVGATRAEAV